MKKLFIFLIALTPLFTSYSLNAQTITNQYNTPKEASTKSDEIISVNLNSKQLKLSKYGKHIIFNLQIKNKTNKNIDGIKGVINIKNISGLEIDNIPFSYDSGIDEYKTVKHKEFYRTNQFIKSDMEIVNTSLKDLSTQIIITSIIFKDGTTIQY